MHLCLQGYVHLQNLQSSSRDVYNITLKKYSIYLLLGFLIKGIIPGSSCNGYRLPSTMAYVSPSYVQIKSVTGYFSFQILKYSLSSRCSYFPVPILFLDENLNATIIFLV